MSGHDPQMRDTSRDAAAVFYDAVRRMTPEARLRAALSMNAMLRRMAEAGVRQRHPEYDDSQVRLAVIRMQLGDRLFAEAYPGLEAQP